MNAISKYAAAKGVKMIMQGEKSRLATDYERQMDTAYRFMKKYDYIASKPAMLAELFLEVSIMPANSSRSS